MGTPSSYEEPNSSMLDSAPVTPFRVLSFGKFSCAPLMTEHVVRHVLFIFYSSSRAFYTHFVPNESIVFEASRQQRVIAQSLRNAGQRCYSQCSTFKPYLLLTQGLNMILTGRPAIGLPRPSLQCCSLKLCSMSACRIYAIIDY